MVCLNKKDWIKFIKRIEEGLKHPVGEVPTPKLKDAEKMIKEEIKMKLLKKKLKQIIDDMGV